MRRERWIANGVGTSGVLLLAFLAACGGGASGGSLGTTAPVAIASDATGMKLVVVGGGIWTSTDGGSTWFDRAPSGPAHIQQWTSVASDAAGTNLVAVVNGFYDLPTSDPAEFDGDVWTSTDSGVTWTDRTPLGPAHGQAWRSVASDASGTKLVAVTAGGGVVLGSGGIWTSTDAGLTWTDATGTQAATQVGLENQSWSSVASDATGQNLVALGTSGVWTSVDAGVTWANQTPADPKFEASFGDQVEGWSSVASDATGSKLVAAVNTGDVWTSTDGGVTWSDIGPATSWQVWVSVASDSTGANLIALDALVSGGNGDVWTSSNGGATWTDLTATQPATSGPWNAVASNASGDHLVVIGRAGEIWTN